ncbi:hypothetical protein [Neisseria musculi]|uniref:hypothetical protein n=1 Tax=Neisseria musculi TaxID=1815583 RepID=UPI00164C4E58|nr:hypothetical protein [Neisseria musculi]
MNNQPAEKNLPFGNGSGICPNYTSASEKSSMIRKLRGLLLLSVPAGSGVPAVVAAHAASIAGMRIEANILSVVMVCLCR